MLRDEVADHYRAKGYTIRERAQVRGTSGAVHTVDLVAMGPLGNLAVAFEDAGGFEGPEMASIQRVAKDIGATPVMAARKVPDGLRKRAAQAGVVLLDDDARSIETVEAPVSDAAIDYPPWPDTARPARDDEPTRPKSTDPGIWKYSRDGEPRKAGFDWLASDAPSEPEPMEIELESIEPAPLKAAPVQTPATKAPIQTPATQKRMDARWFWTLVILGASGGAVFFALSQLV